MSHKKCFFCCEGKLHLFKFLKDRTVRQQWMEFVFGTQPQSCVNVCICDHHFTEDCWMNKGQYIRGFTTRLLLKGGSVPTIKDCVSNPEPQASTSGIPNGQDTKKFTNIACQTEPLNTVCCVTAFCGKEVSRHTVLNPDIIQICSNTVISWNIQTLLLLPNM